MLKITGVKLEKILDIGKYLFIEKGPRGAISYIAKRYAKANNKHMNDYNPKKQSTFHGCKNHSNLEMEAECLTKTLSYLNLNISRTKNARNKL